MQHGMHPHQGICHKSPPSPLPPESHAPPVGPATSPLASQDQVDRFLSGGTRSPIVWSPGRAVRFGFTDISTTNVGAEPALQLEAAPPAVASSSDPPSSIIAATLASHCVSDTRVCVGLLAPQTLPSSLFASFVDRDPTAELHTFAAPTSSMSAPSVSLAAVTLVSTIDRPSPLKREPGFAGDTPTHSVSAGTPLTAQWPGLAHSAGFLAPIPTGTLGGVRGFDPRALCRPVPTGVRRLVAFSVSGLVTRRSPEHLLVFPPLTCGVPAFRGWQAAQSRVYALLPSVAVSGTSASHKRARNDDTGHAGKRGRFLEPALGAPVVPTRAPAPGASTFRCPTLCSCGESLAWTPGTLVVYCSGCQLPSWPSPRSLPPPSQLPTAVLGTDRIGGSWADWFQPIVVSPATPSVASGAVPLSSLLASRVSADDVRWSSIRRDPSREDVVVVCRYDVPIALLRQPLAAWWRAEALLSLVAAAAALGPRFPVHEGDTTVAVLQRVLDHLYDEATATSAAPPVVPLSFLGDSHVFMPYDYLSESPTTRLASLPLRPGPLPLGDPATSAYLELSTTPAAPSPLSVSGHRQLLAGHPLGPYIVNSLRVGFSLGVCGLPLSERSRPRAARLPRSMIDAVSEVPDTVQLEINTGAFMEVSDWPSDACLHEQPWFDVDKSDGGSRGIANLSFGAPSSVNDFTVRPLALLGKTRLAGVARVARRILAMKMARPGVPVLLWKFDLSRAFRAVPLPARDWWMTAHRFGNRAFVHTRLPMGASSAVDIMVALSNSVEDLAARLHDHFSATYVDDSINVAYEDEVPVALQRMRDIWAALGWALNEKKYLADGAPATAIDFLGVRICTETCTVSVTHRRMQQLSCLLEELLVDDGRPVMASQQQLASLAGKLSFVSTVIPHGRVFLRSLFAAASAGEQDVALMGSSSGRAARRLKSSRCDIPVEGVLLRDLAWWKWALPAMNGTAAFCFGAELPSVHLATDASKHGYGCVNLTTREYASGRWTLDERAGGSVAHWELAAIVFAVATWAAGAQGGLVLVSTDSMSGVWAIHNERAVDERMHTLLCVLTAIQLHSKLLVLVEHLPGKLNTVPDDLSRGRCVPATFGPACRVQVPRSIRHCGKNLEPLWLAVPSLGADSRATPQSSTGFSFLLRDVSAAPSTMQQRWALWTKRQGRRAAFSSSSSATSSGPIPTSKARPLETIFHLSRPTSPVSTESACSPQSCSPAVSLASSKCPPRPLPACQPLLTSSGGWPPTATSTLLSAPRSC